MPAACAPAPGPRLHLNPPVAPGSFFARRRRLLVAVVAGVGFLVVAAASSNGWLLLRWDAPFQRLVEANRTEGLDGLFRLASRLGSTMVVLTVAPLMALLAWHRCRAVSLVLVVATAARPVLEFTLKELVSRDRPDLHQLVDGTGPSFPAGHPLAAVALWGLLPVLVGLFTNRRVLWWAAVGVSAVTITAISASRVYLGVHWLSDVVAALLVGALFLVGVEWVLHRVHAASGCRTVQLHAR